MATLSPSAFMIVMARSPAKEAAAAPSMATFSLVDHSAWKARSRGLPAPAPPRPPPRAAPRGRPPARGARREPPAPRRPHQEGVPVRIVLCGAHRDVRPLGGGVEAVLA